TNRRRGSTASSGSSAPLAKEKVPQPEIVPVKAEKIAESSSTDVKSEAKDSKESKGGSPASAPSTPASGENSVYRIGFDGGVREVFREKTLVLSLLRQGDKCIVGTGMEGQLFEVDETTRERAEIARLDHGQI